MMPVTEMAVSVGGPALMRPFSSLMGRRLAYPPPVDGKALRDELNALDIPEAAAALAVVEQPAADETRPTAIEARISSLCDDAQAFAEQVTLERIEQVSGEADLLDSAANEATSSRQVDALENELKELAADAGIALPPLAQEKVRAALQLRAFLQRSGIFGDPPYKPWAIRWVAIGLITILLETLFTAWLYSPVLGDRQSLMAALFIGISVTVSGLIIAWGILLAKHRRSKLAGLTGPVIILLGVLVFLFAALCAAHFRLILGDTDDLSDAVEIALNTVETAVAVAESLFSKPSLPLADPRNLGFILLNGATVGGFVRETKQTWVHWGFRDVAARNHHADRQFRRGARDVVADMKEAGGRSKREIKRQIQELKLKDQDSRSLHKKIMLILAAHSTAVVHIAGLRQWALALLLDSYRSVAARGRPISPTFAQYRQPVVGTSITLPPDFDQKLDALRTKIYDAINQRAQDQALIDAKVSGAMITFSQYLTSLLASSEGVPLPPPPQN